MDWGGGTGEDYDRLSFEAGPRGRTGSAGLRRDKPGKKPSSYRRVGTNGRNLIFTLGRVHSIIKRPGAEGLDAD